MQRIRPPLAVALALVLVVPLAHSAVAAGGPTGAVGPAVQTEGPVGTAPAAPTAGPSGATSTAAGNASMLFVIRDQPNTTNYLAIRDQFVETERYGNGSLNVAGALAADARRAQQIHAQLTFQQKFERAGSREARIALLRNQTRHVAAAIQTLAERQQQAITAFNAGDISTAQFLRRLATLDAMARELDRRLQRLKTGWPNAQSFRVPSDLATRIDGVRAGLVPLRGNVRAHIGQMFAGAQAGGSIYIQTSSSGIVLTTIDGSTVVREAYLAGRRRPDQPDKFAKADEPRIILAHQRASDLYPWAYSIGAGPNVDGFGLSSVYRITHTHPHGRLTAFLDGGSGDIYRELQRKRLAPLPMHNVSKTNNTLTIRANYSHATGPMQVSVTDADSGEPVAATVYVNGQPVGHTGPDGVLWTVAPHGGVRIQARTDTGDIDLNFFANK